MSHKVIYVEMEKKHEQQQKRVVWLQYLDSQSHSDWNYLYKQLIIESTGEVKLLVIDHMGLLEYESGSFWNLACSSFITDEMYLMLMQTSPI